MASSERAFGGRQAARRHLVTMAGTLILVLVVIDLVVLYGLDVIRRESDGYAAATERMLEATDESRAAEVAFKTQVQEWKNILLRGHDPQDLERYRAAFERQEAEVESHLRQVREHAGELGLSAGAVDDVLALHTELAQRYDAALQGVEPGTPEAAWRVDRSVRGMDRPLTEAFDALVAEVRTAADSRRAAVQARMAEVAETQRLVLIAAHGIGILLVLGSLLLALRALRR